MTKAQTQMLHLREDANQFATKHNRHNGLSMASNFFIRGSAQWPDLVFGKLSCALNFLMLCMQRQQRGLVQDRSVERQQFVV